MPPGSSSSFLPSRRLRGRGLHRLHVELDVDALADQHAAGLEHLVPGEPELLAIDRRLRDEARALVAPRVGAAAAVLDVEHDLADDVANAEDAGHAIALVGHALDARAAV